MRLPHDYAEKVYAGVLGKIIGVYLGRPFEGWENARIERELGEITGYVHERLGSPLVVPDDDISGTFVFIRALQDAGADRAITPAAIGRAWLNYLIEEAAAFVEADIDRLLDTAVALIPNDSLIARLIGDVRDWHAAAGGAQWRQTFARIRGRYGYDRYGGNCHVVPNHALIIMALLAGGGDFDRSLTIVESRRGAPGRRWGE